MTAAVWTEEERAAWAPTERLTVSECADRYRVLGPEHAEPGPFQTDRNPAFRQIQDAMGVCGLVVVKCAAQVGKSAAEENLILYAAKLDPGPALLVLPDQNTAEEKVDERIKPMIASSLVSETTDRAHDLKIKRLRLTSMDIYIAWATSPSRLAARSVRYVIMDEVNKYVEWSGKDADPIALAKARTRIWGERARIVLVSTPTTSSGNITKAYEECLGQYIYAIPCPHCSEFFEPLWSRVKFPRLEGEDDREWSIRVAEQPGAVWLECPSCEGRLSEVDRVRALRSGHWQTEGGELYRDLASVGFQLGVLGTPWTPMSKLASKWVVVKDDPAKLFEFVTQDLGQEFEEQLHKVEDTVIDQKSAEGYKRFLVPAWAGHIIAGVDTQLGHFYYVVRAWGRSYRSRLLDYGRADSFEHLKALLLDAEFPIEGFESTGLTAGVSALCIDARGGTAASQGDGSRTDEVYRWSLSDPRIKPVLGAGGKSIDSASFIYRVVDTKYEPKVPGHTNPYKVVRYSLNVGYFKDNLAARINHEDPSLWEVFGEVGDDYIRQMTSEQKVIVRKGQKVTYEWRKKAKGLPNHLWDAENYASFGALLLASHHLPDEQTLTERRRLLHRRRLAQREADEREGRDSNWATGGSWGGPGGGSWL